jgi:uncharacterized membrane protein
MRIHFREEPWDLYLCIGYTLAVTCLQLGIGLRHALAILLVAFAPGYVVIAALFPARGEIGWTERIILSLGADVAVVPLLGLLLGFTPFGLRPASIAVALAIFTLLTGLAAYRRRMRLPVQSRLSADVELSRTKWNEQTAVDNGLRIALFVSVIVAVASIAYVFLTPAPGQPFTEFYILGPGGNATAYPTTLNVSQPGTIVLGVGNHETIGQTYTIRVDLIDLEIVHNATTGTDETVEVNRSTLSWLNVSLAEGANWTYPYTFRINAVGLWRIDFLLYKNSVITDQELHILVRVS